MIKIDSIKFFTFIFFLSITFNINVKGTDNIVKSILKTNRNLKLVFISSDAVYGAYKGNFKENDKLAPYNYYGKTKVLAEKKSEKSEKK